MIRRQLKWKRLIILVREENVTDSIDIDDLTYQELQLECKKQGLSQGGNASTLRKS